MGEWIVRFLIGGAVVSFFSAIGDVLKPKSFAGMFGAAPSVALATLGLAIFKHGGPYGATEGRSMMLGAIALSVYSFVVCRLLGCHRCHAWVAASLSLVIWFGAAFGLFRLLPG